jgi:ABC-type ATPase involved in cell division
MIRFDRVSYRYPEAASPTFAGLDWSVAPGAFVLVAGQSGAGVPCYAA